MKNSKRPEISVIMTAYNETRFISESIDSVLNQSFRDFELIIINDRSTDDTYEKIKTYNDKRIVLLNNEKNLGRARSRNRGLKIAQGKYIAILDAGDIALRYRLEKQYTYLESNQEIFLLGSGAYNIDTKSRIISSFHPILSTDNIPKALEKENCIYHITVMFRNEGFFYREKFLYAQDYDLYLRIILANKKICNLKEILGSYRIDCNSVSHNSRGRQLLFAQKSREMYFQKKLFGNDDYEEFDPESIMRINEYSSNRKFLEGEISLSFQFNDFQRLKMLISKYYEIGIVIDKILFYYILSFCPEFFIVRIKRTIYKMYYTFNNITTGFKARF